MSGSRFWKIFKISLLVKPMSMKLTSYENNCSLCIKYCEKSWLVLPNTFHWFEKKISSISDFSLKFVLNFFS